MDDHVNPICIEALTKYKIVDVGCGMNFTVVLVGSESNNHAYNHLK